ncbi:MAG: PAS domain-containing protein [Candidatus Rokubacteria bacterium]|nr:PAS domain-containing protein [Candidatus Rokubacteria bacterium]
MVQFSLLAVAATLVALAAFVWRARPGNAINCWFAAFTMFVGCWTVGIAGLQSGTYLEVWGRFTFAAAAFIPAAFLAFTRCYPTLSRWPSPTVIRSTLVLAAIFAFMSGFTSLLFYDVSMTEQGLARKPGSLYVPFALYFVITFGGAIALLISKWWHVQGLARAQLQFLGSGVIISGAGAISANLLLPLATGRSTYAWLGPSFGVVLVALVAHAIIRHRLMDLRLVIHHGLAYALAMLLSLAPVAVLLAFFWPRLSSHLRRGELLIFLAAIALVSLLVPLTKDLAERVLDRYVYRTHANYQRIVREASQVLTGVLELKVLLPFLSRTVAASTEAEGVGIYLQAGPDFVKASAERRHPEGRFESPERAPASVAELLVETRQPLLAEEIAREGPSDGTRLGWQDLTRLNWSLVLPLLSKNAVIGAIVVGPKRSGDPFYPQDLDLLMTLANQAGIAIKNAQLYAQVVLVNEYIQNIVATIESGVVAIDPAGRITLFNRAAEQLTGHSSAEMTLQHVSALPASLSEPLLTTLDDGLGRTEPDVDLPGAGVTRPVICTTSPLRDPAGSVLGAVAVFSDLTPLKELEIERRRAERLAYFEVLASGIAHEIKNPLVAVKTFAQLVPRRQGDERFLDNFSRIVTREIARMERLVDRLRTLSRLSERPRHSLDLRTPISEALEFLQAAFDEKRIAVTVDLGDAPRFVAGDHGELEQLFLNLTLNAHEAMAPGGALEVRLAATESAAIVTVADTGAGVPPELLERIFDPFFTTKQRGSGLGLAICAGIADAHRAKLRVANRTGGGAIFTVEFPLTAPVTAPVQA